MSEITRQGNLLWFWASWWWSKLVFGLRVLNHCILSTLKPQENSLAADKQLWKPALGFVPCLEQCNRLLTVSHQHKPGCCNDRKCLSQSAGCLDEFWELSLARIAFLVPTPCLPTQWPSTPGTKPWECELCRAAARRHLFRQPTQGKVSYTGLVWATASNPTLTSTASIYTLWHWGHKNQETSFYFHVTRALTQARPAKTISR